MTNPPMSAAMKSSASIGACKSTMKLVWSISGMAIFGSAGILMACHFLMFRICIFDDIHSKTTLKATPPPITTNRSSMTFIMI